MASTPKTPLTTILLPSEQIERATRIKTAVIESYIAAGKPKPKENWLYSQLVQSRLSFELHTEAVGQFLNDLYAILIDPCAEGSMKVQEMCAAIKQAAIEHRDAVEKGK